MTQETYSTYHKVLAERWGRREWVGSCHSRLRPRCPCLGPGPCSQRCHSCTTCDAVTNNTHMHVTNHTEQNDTWSGKKPFTYKHYTLCCIYLGLWHTGGVRPLALVLLCPTPPWVTEAWMIRDITSLATQTPRDTHAPLTGLDSWIHTGRQQQADH